MPYTVSAEDGNLRVKESGSRPGESKLLGLKEITHMAATQVKRKESSSHNRRRLQRRKGT